MRGTFRDGGSIFQPPPFFFVPSLLLFLASSQPPTFTQRSPSGKKRLRPSTTATTAPVGLDVVPPYSVHAPTSGLLVSSQEHLKAVMEQIGKLEEALYNIQFEQNYLEAQTERHQSMVNDAMSKRAIYKALFESAALISASVLQVYLLRRLFDVTPLNKVKKSFLEVNLYTCRISCG